MSASLQASSSTTKTALELRRQYPVFTYEKFSIEEHTEQLQIIFHFRLGDIHFKPQIEIQKNRASSTQSLESFVFHLGLIESISYWKAACSPRIVVNAGTLSDKQTTWWQYLLLHGMGEFFYRNEIDFSAADFVRIESEGPTYSHDGSSREHTQGALLLIAGGKDSSLALELLKAQEIDSIVPFSLNPTRATLDSARIAGWPKILQASRTIDPKLLELNQQGFLNGHTPFSAYLAFLSALVASANGYRRIIVCNEESANEGNVVMHGLEVNHQYSKSLDFEKKFRSYVVQYLSSDLDYFSFLRPLSDLQVSALFADYPEQLQSFRSCNVGQRQDSWCGSCPKCAFVYLSLYPFVGHTRALSIFGSDLFARKEIIEHVRALVGLTPTKPFECVGSVAESREALTRCVLRMQEEARVIPESLLQIEREVGPHLAPSKVHFWNSDHCLPSGYEALLKNRIATKNWQAHA